MNRPQRIGKYLPAFTMICLGVARIGFQRDQEKMYG